MTSGTLENNLLNSLERHSSRRMNAKWLERAKRDPRSRFLLVFRDMFLAEGNLESGNPKPTFLEGQVLDSIAEGLPLTQESIYLGDYDEVALFAIGIDETLASALTREDFASKREFVDLRSNLPLMNAMEANMVALARFLVRWNRRNQFCGVCGAKTEKMQDGHARKCGDAGCGEEFYASMDPAVIVLVTHGEKALLGRARNWRSGLYSTLAGFVEPGETLEEAVRREIWEESGIRVGEVTYQASQPWLFPASLMLGFTAKALNEEIEMDAQEMDDVRWFTREELLASPETFPSSASIAFQLIRSWLDS